MKRVIAGKAASRTNRELALLGTGVLALTIVGPFVHHRFGSFAFFLLIMASALGAARAMSLGARADDAQALWIVLAVAAVLRFAMLGVDNYFSLDIFRYVWDGRVQAAGVNPYRYTPAAPELAFLRDAAIYPRINRADYAVTIYPPVAQMIYFAVTRFGESVLVMKAAFVAFDAITIAALMAILRRLGRPMALVVAYAWHPLPVWEIAVNGHVDAAMVALLTLGLWAALAARRLIAGALVMLAALVKPTALLALPALWRRWDVRLPAVVAATAAVAFAPYLSIGSGMFAFWPGYASEEGLTTGARFWILTTLQDIIGPIPNGTVVYLAFAITILAGLAIAVAFERDRTDETSLRRTAWLIFVFLLLLSPAYPWYFLALVPFLVLVPSSAFWAMTVLAFLLYDVIDNDRVMHLDTRKNVLYGATLVCLGYEASRLLQKRRRLLKREATT